MKEKGYRLNVGLIIANSKGKLLLCKRKGMNSWQFPQGGIDFNEVPIKAAKRELFEEVGIDYKNVKLIHSLDDWLKYEIPKKSRRRKIVNNNFKGQKQKWFLFKFLGKDKDINITTEQPEFSKWKWISKESLLDEIVPFKKSVYKNVLKEFYNI